MESEKDVRGEMVLASIDTQYFEANIASERACAGVRHIVHQFYNPTAPLYKLSQVS
jgi:hypothetical protein